MGNICRSPALGATLEKLVRDRGLEKNVYIDSCAITHWFIGSKADPRMSKAAAKRNIVIDHTAKFFEEYNFEVFDYILAVDHEVLSALKELASTPEQLAKLHLAGEYSDEEPFCEMLDPYYGGEEGFERTMDMAEEICSGFFRKVVL